MMTIKKTFSFSSALLLATFNVNAATINKNTAVLQAMDKITGSSSIIEIPVNSSKDFEDFSIVIRQCKTNPPEETPESYAFVDIADTSKEKEKNIYKGWMLSSSPALNPLEHPMYDLWLLECVDTNTENATLLTQEQLQQRDNIKTIQEIEDNKDEAENVNVFDDGLAPIAPKDVVNIEDTKVEFNAIEEEAQKAQELQETESILEELLEEPKEEIVEEVAEEAKEEPKAQLIDFSNFNVE